MLNLWREQFLTPGSILGEAALARLKYLEINRGSFFLYVLKKRLGSIWILALLSTTFLGVAAAYAYMLWVGAGTGFLLSAFVIQYGMKGILLFLASIFPHYLLYIPALILLLAWSVKVSRQLYFPQKDDAREHGGRRQMAIRFAFRLLAVHGIAIIGCLLESYVNPNMITNILKIF